MSVRHWSGVDKRQGKLRRSSGEGSSSSLHSSTRRCWISRQDLLLLCTRIASQIHTSVHYADMHNRSPVSTLLELIRCKSHLYSLHQNHNAYVTYTVAYDPWTWSHLPSSTECNNLRPGACIAAHLTAIMADIATPAAAALSTIDAGSEPTQKPQKTKPEKPDEQKYKESLGKAQKEHAAAQEKVVRLSNPKVPTHYRNPIG